MPFRPRYRIAGPTAALFIGFESASCTEVSPMAPTIVQTSCAGVRQTRPLVTLPANNEAITYTRSGTVAAGQTVTVTATLQPGYGWPEDTSGVAGWEFETTTATYTVQLADVPCDIVSRVIRTLIAILSRLR